MRYGAAGGAGQQAVREERGAALIGAVLLAAALAIVAGAVGWFALLASQTSAAARDHAEVAAAAQAGLEIAAGALAREPDIAAVRLGLAVGPGGADRLVTPDGTIDVPTLTRQLEQRRLRQPPPADVAVWRPYLWGRLGELASAIPAVGGRDPLVVVWVRGDEARAAPAPIDSSSRSKPSVRPARAPAPWRRSAADRAASRSWPCGRTPASPVPGDTAARLGTRRHAAAASCTARYAAALFAAIAAIRAACQGAGSR